MVPQILTSVVSRPTKQCELKCELAPLQEPGLAGEAWAYCNPKIDYSAVRSTVGTAFAAKGAELHRAISTVQQLTKAAAEELKLFQERCP